MNSRSELNRLILTLSRSADLLEPAAYQAVCDFIRQSQTGSGAFMDRGKEPDSYYSFFGYLMCRAFGLTDELSRLRCYVMNSAGTREPNLADWSVRVLLRCSFKPGFLFRLWNSFRLLVRWIRERTHSDTFYLTFLTLLILNHFWGYSHLLLRPVSRLTAASRFNSHSPTSHLAAALCIRSHAGLDPGALPAMLMNRAHSGGGFVAFPDNATADMLSTAVAIYALRHTRTDIRLLTSTGLNYVSTHFDGGAFLSGDGDPTRDVEYTFYGLLALSAYAQPVSE